MDDQIQRTAKGEYGQYLQKRNKNEQEIEANKQRIEDIEADIEQAIRRKEELDANLKKYEGVTQKIQEKSEKEVDSQKLQESLRTQRDSLASQLSSVAPFLCFDVIKNVHSEIGKKIEKKEIPSQIRVDLILDLLRQKKCICGRHLDDDSPECQLLHQWMTEVASSQKVGDAALELHGELGQFVDLDFKKDIIRSTENTLRSYMIDNNRYLRLQDDIASILDEIGTNQNEDIKTFGDQLKKTEKDIIEKRAEILNLNKENEKLQSESDELKIKIEKEEKEKNIRGVNQSKRDLVDGAKKILSCVQDEYIKKVRERISEKTAENMRLFLDKESRDFFSDVEVDEKYSLQITDPQDNPFLADISAGQRQLLSLAFITASAQTAAAEQLPDMPLFMDTPFGRLSLDHRQNLINHIPSLCAQWVLLVTDTELRREEAEDLKQTGKLGRFYRLVFLDENETRIESIDIERAIRQLNSGKGIKT